MNEISKSNHGRGQSRGNSGKSWKQKGYQQGYRQNHQQSKPAVHNIEDQADSDADAKKRVFGESIMPSTLNLNCIPPLNMNYINAHNDNLFLHAQVKEGNNKDQDLIVLPDGGNRAKCILRYHVYKKLFPDQLLRPVDDVITMAKQQDRIEIVGTPEKKIDFILANG